MEPEGSLPCSQEPSIGPYTEPEKCSPHPHTLYPVFIYVCMYVCMWRKFYQYFSTFLETNV
jgi:hypothetical protein